MDVDEVFELFCECLASAVRVEFPFPDALSFSVFGLVFYNGCNLIYLDRLRRSSEFFCSQSWWC